jgi:hypothetical protein
VVGDATSFPGWVVEASRRVEDEGRTRQDSEYSSAAKKEEQTATIKKGPALGAVVAGVLGGKRRQTRKWIVADEVARTQASCWVQGR